MCSCDTWSRNSDNYCGFTQAFSLFSCKDTWVEIFRQIIPVRSITRLHTLGHPIGRISIVAGVCRIRSRRLFWTNCRSFNGLRTLSDSISWQSFCDIVSEPKGSPRPTKCYHLVQWPENYGSFIIPRPSTPRMLDFEHGRFLLHRAQIRLGKANKQKCTVKAKV